MKKKATAEMFDASDVEGFVKSRLRTIPALEDRGEKLVGPRRARERTASRIGHLSPLPEIYAGIIRMGRFAFTFGMQARPTADLVDDPDFAGNDAQGNGTKTGLGLREPSKEFWLPVAGLMAGMTSEDKVDLLACIVSRFGEIRQRGRDAGGGIGSLRLGIGGHVHDRNVTPLRRVTPSYWRTN